MPAGSQQAGNHNGPYILNVMLLRQTKVHFYMQFPVQNVVCSLANGPSPVTVPNLTTNYKKGRHVLIEKCLQSV